MGSQTCVAVVPDVTVNEPPSEVFQVAPGPAAVAEVPPVGVVAVAPGMVVPETVVPWPDCY